MEHPVLCLWLDLSHFALLIEKSHTTIAWLFAFELVGRSQIKDAGFHLNRKGGQQKGDQQQWYAED
jgi:hypothetical protein